MTAMMVQGCTSWAGKSLLATALCRWYADQGLRVLPFKAQNMSTNARVVPDRLGGHGEIGVAQWLQARAARVDPDVRMNPVLVKPESGGRSQVVRLGHHDPALSALGWTERPPFLWPVVTDALDSLVAESDLVVCEGAGSPAEINLCDTDLANMAVAHHADAPVLLAVDIDRGGSFAHLYGTWALLDDAGRDRLAGFVLNRFRGDPGLLRDAPAQLSRRTGMGFAGVLPMIEHGLPDEDGARRPEPWPAAALPRPTVAVIRWPHASNLDEFAPLHHRASLRWADRPDDLTGADLIVLPGSKDVAADLGWLHERGLAGSLTRRATAGGAILGICGGMFALATSIRDPAGVEGGRGAWSAPGLGLLPVSVRYDCDKLTAPWQGTFAETLPTPWSALNGHRVAGYDIRHGRVSGDTAAVLGSDRGWASGGVLGVTVHGLFSDEHLAAALLPGLVAGPADLEPTFDALAAAVEEHLDTDLLARLTGGLL